jgi:hypothetical protein
VAGQVEGRFDVIASAPRSQEEHTVAAMCRAVVDVELTQGPKYQG